MDNILNVNEIDGYCEAFTKAVIEEKVEGERSVSGNDLLTLTPVKQVNLFVIKNLYAEWIEESKKIESPYFDYEAEEVKVAQKKFMNVLSKHIKIGAKDLTPILTSACKEAILLIYSPYGFYTHLADEHESLHLEKLKNISKYIKVNQQIFKSLIALLEAQNIEHISKDNVISALNNVFENTDASPDDVSPFFDSFSSVIPLKEEIVYGKKQDNDEVKTEVVENTDESSEVIEDDEIIAEGESEKEQPEQEHAENTENKEQTILNDKLSKDEKSSLADIHQMKKIHDIQKHLSINQRFMFIRALFDNDENHFRNTVNSLEQLDNAKEALGFLQDEFPHWDTESEEYEEFIEIVEKRLEK